MPDIVPNLLRLSSEVNDVSDFWDPVLDLLCSATIADAAAIVLATPPHWCIVAVRGIARSDVPFDLAAEAIERDAVAASEGWRAGPIAGVSKASAVAEPGYVFLSRCNC
ncbi:MAG TPA: hypothetical protein VH107_13550, partial [Lacipirellulaceae bacterium]|nr:hypothetical protein [Lacipirellulaceae bacterium]